MKVSTTNLWINFVKRLPKRLVYFCAMQLCAEVTSGKYGNTIVPELTFMDAVKQFENKYKI